MVLATGETRSRSAGRQRPIFGPAVWGWALATGLALWALGFVLLPWWAALLIWWWPSIIGGAAVGLATISIVQLVTRATTRRRGPRQSDAERPSG